MRNFSPLFSLCIALLAFASCKKDPEFIAPDSSYGLIYTRIFETSCALSACHGQEKKNDGFSAPLLEGSGTYAAIVNAAVENTQAANAGLKLIVPNDPDASFLYQKIIYDSSASQFGSKMPQGGITLSADEIAFVRQWIAAGAPETGHVADRTLIE